MDFISFNVCSVKGQVPRESGEDTALPYRASCAHSVARRMLLANEFVTACLALPAYSLHDSNHSTSIPAFEPFQKTSSQGLIATQLLLLASTYRRLEAQNALGKQELQLPGTHLLLFGTHDRAVPHDGGESFRDRNPALLRNAFDRRNGGRENLHQVWKQACGTSNLLVGAGRSRRELAGLCRRAHRSWHRQSVN